MIRVLIVGGLNVDQSLWSLYHGMDNAGCTVSHIPTRTVVDGVKGFRDGLEPLILDAAKDADLLLWWQAKDYRRPEFITELRKKYPKLKTMSWSVDDPHVLDKYSPEPYKLFEYGATCCKGSMEWYRGHGVEPVFLLTPCDPIKHGKAVATPAEVCDIGFASTNTYPRERWPEHLADRAQIVRILWDLGKVHLYGQWDTHVASWGGGRNGLSDKYRVGSRGHRKFAEMPGVYAACRINLGTSVRPDAYLYINRRVVECMASGGFMLSDRTNGITDMLVEDKEIVLWSNLDELRSKCKFYLAHDDSRKKIAAAGRVKALDVFDSKKAARHVLKEVGLA